MIENDDLNNTDETNCNGSSQSLTIYASLNNLIKNGIEIDKNLRQPTYYSWIDSDELKVESFAIITDLLHNQKVPLWLSQRIGWFYSSKYLKDIANDLSIPNDVKDKDTSNEYNKSFNRDKLVVYLRKSISKIVKEWLNEKTKHQNEKKQYLLFSFARYDQEILKKNLQYFEFGLKNKRRNMEDKIAIIENTDLIRSEYLTESTLDASSNLNKFNYKSPALFAVFDGHLGTNCSQYLSSHLPSSIIQHPEFNPPNKINQSLIDSFRFINEKFTQKAREESIKSGSTCCLCVLSSSEANKDGYTSLDAAWCGDTQFCLVKSGQISYISDEHKPNDPAEKERIEKLGGSISFTAGTWRVGDSLAVSRSFGDIDYQPYITSEPQLKHIDLDGTEDYLLIGCDGLWESLEKDELCSFVYENRNSSQNIAELLVRKSLANGSSDNITAIFVLLKESLTQITKPSN